MVEFMDTWQGPALIKDGHVDNSKAWGFDGYGRIGPRYLIVENLGKLVGCQATVQRFHCQCYINWIENGPETVP
jgi:hypothetical protein